MAELLKINEIFESIQGEGKYVGYPALFIRLSSCDLSCSWCDTKYHEKVNSKLLPKALAFEITTYNKEIIVWTGGEPTLQADLIKQTILIEKVNSLINSKLFKHHLETNGESLIRLKWQDLKVFITFFDYIAFSPKTVETAKKLAKIAKEFQLNTFVKFDIKVTTDLELVGVDMLGYATMLMPITVKNVDRTLKIKQKVWHYCVVNNIRYSPRLHIDVFGLKRGV